MGIIVNCVKTKNQKQILSNRIENIEDGKLYQSSQN